MGKFYSLITAFATAFVLLVLPLLRQESSPVWQENPEICPADYRSVSRPLTELGLETYTRMDGQVTEFTGGLYPDGSNVRPAEHEAAGQALAAQIVPLDVEGRPDPLEGKIGLLSIGMSNTDMEFGAFIEMVRQNPQVNSHLALINGAQPNRTAERWVDPLAPPWMEIERRLERQRLSAAQVQVAWIKQTHTRGGDFPAKAQALQSDLEAIARNLRAKFPNLKLAFFSSRTRSYMIERGLSPEPVAFEGGFAVKWMIEKQINGDAGLNYDPAMGDAAVPYLSWGPYLWIDGTQPRLDGRVWLAEDLRSDCTHPSQAGTRKVAEMLFEFFSTDSLTRSWFLASGAPAVTLTVDGPAGSLSTVIPTQTNSPADSSRSTPAVTPVAMTEAGLLATPVPAKTATPAAVSGLPATVAPLDPASTEASLPERRLAPLGLAFVILLFLSGGAGVWFLLRRGRG